MAPELTTAFNIGATSLGLFGSMYFWAYAVGQLPADPGRPIASEVPGHLRGCSRWGFVRRRFRDILLDASCRIRCWLVYVPAMRFWQMVNHRVRHLPGILLAVGNIGALVTPHPGGIDVRYWESLYDLSRCRIYSSSYFGLSGYTHKPMDRRSYPARLKAVPNRRLLLLIPLGKR